MNFTKLDTDEQMMVVHYLQAEYFEIESEAEKLEESIHPVMETIKKSPFGSKSNPITDPEEIIEIKLSINALEIDMARLASLITKITGEKFPEEYHNNKEA